MKKFKKDDIIRWVSFTGVRDLAVIEVWEDEPKSLLLTDTCHTTMKTYVALQCDCEVIEAASEATHKDYRRRVRDVKPTIKVDNTPMGDG